MIRSFERRNYIRALDSGELHNDLSRLRLVLVILLAHASHPSEVKVTNDPVLGSKFTIALLTSYIYP